MDGFSVWKSPVQCLTLLWASKDVLMSVCLWIKELVSLGIYQLLYFFSFFIPVFFWKCFGSVRDLYQCNTLLGVFGAFISM